MPKRIREKVRKEIEKLYDNGYGMPRPEISRQTGVSISSIYGITSLRKRINPETGKPFKSRGEQFEYLAGQRINPKTREPFESLKKLQEYLIKQRINPEKERRFKSETEYLEYLARQKINPETRRRFKSRSQLQNYQARQRQRRPINQRLSDLVGSRLSEIGKNQRWLAKKLSSLSELGSA